MITKDTLIGDALRKGNTQKLAEVLQNYGMHCFGCAIARGETVEQAAGVHGVNVDEMVEKLNTAANS
jgi:hybrid cluster-associated redox disulfide protein